MKHFLNHVKKPSKHAFVEAGLLASIIILAVGFVIYVPPFSFNCELLESKQSNQHCRTSPNASAPSSPAFEKEQRALERKLENEQAQ